MYVKKGDFILIGSILAVAAVSLLVYRYMGSVAAQWAVVTVDGQEYGRYPLDEDQEILIQGAAGGTNLLVIKDGYADVTDASCPDKLCVHQHKIRDNGETIVCLPNKVVVTAVNSGRPALDGVVR